MNTEPYEQLHPIKQDPQEVEEGSCRGSAKTKKRTQ